LSNKINELFLQELKVVNLGIKEFADNLKDKKDVSVIHVKWRPPAGGDRDLLSLLDKLR